MFGRHVTQTSSLSLGLLDKMVRGGDRRRTLFLLLLNTSNATKDKTFRHIKINLVFYP